MGTARSELHITGYVQGADGIAGSEGAAIDGDAADCADTTQSAACIDRGSGIGNGTIDREDAAIDGGSTRVGVGAGEVQVAGAGFIEAATRSGDHTAESSRGVISACCQLMTTTKIT